MAGTVTIISAPTVNSIYVSNVKRTEAYVQFNIASNGGSPITSAEVCCYSHSGMSSGSATATISGSTAYGTITGLQPNTVYYFYGTATNSAGTGETNTIYRETTGNPPTINNVITSPIKTSCNIISNISYDVNDYFRYMDFSYGTTTDYGTTIRKNSSSAFWIDYLEPNTKYYYRLDVTSHMSRHAYYSGEFTTLSNSETDHLINNASVTIDNNRIRIDVPDQGLNYYLSTTKGNTWSSSLSPGTYYYTLTPGQRYDVCIQGRTGDRFSLEHYSVQMPDTGVEGYSRKIFRQEGHFKDMKTVYISSLGRWIEE